MDQAAGGTLIDTLYPCQYRLVSHHFFRVMFAAMSTYPYTMQPIPYELSVAEQREAQLMLQHDMIDRTLSIKTWAILAAVTAAAIAGLVLVDGYSTVLFWLMLVGVVVFLVARIVGWPYFIRWQVERELDKHQLQAISGIKIGVQPQGLVMVQKIGAQEGRGVVSWKDFSEWRENDKFLYLFFSVKGQQGTQIIPKSMAAKKLPIETIRKHLTESVGAAK
jgi:hypothetical protein